MKNTIHTLTCLALAAVVAAGCGKQEEDVVITGSPLSFGIAGEAGASTKADNRVKEDTQVTEFTVGGYTGSEEWFPETTVSTSTTYDNYLWRNGVSHTFYAYANLPEDGATASIASTGVTLTYSAVPATQADQKDILLGSYSGTGNEGEATIRFYHPLTAVSFKVGTIANISAITGITVTGVYKSGSVTLSETSGTPAFAWTANTPQSVSQQMNVTTFTADASLGDPFLLIPQTAASGITIEMTVTTTGGGSKTVSGSLGSVNWQHGKNNVYTINYDGGHKISFSPVSVTAWGSNEGGSANASQVDNPIFDGLTITGWGSNAGGSANAGETD